MLLIKKGICILLVFFVSSFHANAELNSEIRCKATGKTVVSSLNGKKKIKYSGDFKVSKEKSGKVFLISDKGKKLIIIYPWYGIHYKKLNEHVFGLKVKTDDETYIDLDFRYKNKRYVYDCVKR